MDKGRIQINGPKHKQIGDHTQDKLHVLRKAEVRGLVSIENYIDTLIQELIGYTNSKERLITTACKSFEKIRPDKKKTTNTKK